MFQKLTTFFGNQMQAKWQGLNMQEVYSAWAESMQDLSLGSINHGIELSKQDEHPPSLGKFIEHCKKYQPPLIENRLEKLHVKDTTVGRERIANIRDMLAIKMKAY